MCLCTPPRVTHPMSLLEFAPNAQSWKKSEHCPGPLMTAPPPATTPSRALAAPAVSGSCTLDTTVVGYGLKNLDATRFSSAANSCGTTYHIPDMAPPFLTKEDGPPTKKELDPEVIRTSHFPHFDSHGWAGSCHLTAQSVLSSSPDSAHTRAPGNHTWGFSSTG
jgi:hypothetical protein